MKKIMILSLSLLMAAGTMQPAFGMANLEDEAFHAQPQHNPTEYRKAKKEVKIAGHLSGLGTGSLWGLAIVSAGFGIKNFIYSNNTIVDSAPGIIGFTGLGFLASYVYNTQKTQVHTAINNNPHLTENDKSKLKNKFKKENRVANTLMSAAVVTAPLIALQNADKQTHPLLQVPQKFCTTFPAVLTGVAGWSWLTNYKTSKKPLQQAAVLQPEPGIPADVRDILVER